MLSQESVAMHAFVSVLHRSDAVYDLRATSADDTSVGVLRRLMRLLASFVVVVVVYVAGVSFPFVGLVWICFLFSFARSNNHNARIFCMHDHFPARTARYCCCCRVTELTPKRCFPFVAGKTPQKIIFEVLAWQSKYYLVSFYSLWKQPFKTRSAAVHTQDTHTHPVLARDKDSKIGSPLNKLEQTK